MQRDTWKAYDLEDNAVTKATAMRESRKKRMTFTAQDSGLEGQRHARIKSMLQRHVRAKSMFETTHICARSLCTKLHSENGVLGHESRGRLGT
jgi:hypothetical protein